MMNTQTQTTRKPHKTRKDVNQERKYIEKDFQADFDQCIWETYVETIIPEKIEKNKAKWIKNNIPEARFTLEAKKSTAQVKSAIRGILDLTGKSIDEITVNDMREYKASTRESKYNNFVSFILYCVNNNIMEFSQEVRFECIPDIYKKLAM